MDGLAETLMVPDPAALGVKVKVAAAIPLGVRVVGAKVPERPAAAGVRTTLDGQAAPVGATVRVTALPTVPELEDRDVVKAVAAAGVGVGVGAGLAAANEAAAVKAPDPCEVGVNRKSTGQMPAGAMLAGLNVPWMPLTCGVSTIPGGHGPFGYRVTTVTVPTGPDGTALISKAVAYCVADFAWNWADDPAWGSVGDVLADIVFSLSSGGHRRSTSRKAWC